MGNINGHETRVTAAWLRMRLAEAETAQRICLIDATPTADAPCLPYARPLAVRTLLNDGMPTPEEFQAALRAIGATSFDQVVIYDRNLPLASSILWRLFRCFGHRDACILDGGYDAWCTVSGELVESYSKHEAGTWRAAGVSADRELLAEIDALRQMFRAG
ncbi:MAG: thiosulfate/3-mercaptopyruvate sulfurtransferase [Alphaproteobacteria bacterium]|jgi:3-mercaptopyruvate sulfurtransferase SseA|nr:thiosulfate/3-mercaptopyruvate sulfurtransferase [Alphaproteobacteria bacterium]